MSQEVIFRARQHVLQMSAPVGFNVLDTWPAATFDGKDQISFLSAGLVDRDVYAIKLGLSISTGGSRQQRPSEYDFMFFAMGWASLNLGSLQCSVVDCSKYEDQLSAVETTIHEWQEARKDVAETLRYYKIPKSPIVVFQSRPKTAEWVVVWFDAVMICDILSPTGRFGA